MASARALQLKEEGNKCFESNDFIGAEALYSKAIIVEPTNPILYTNRAMARLKLHLYDAVIPDCFSSLNLLSENMKAHYYLAQAELELGRLEDAYKSALIAYDFCSGGKSGVVVDRAWERSLTLVTSLVLHCKREVWQKKEKDRLKARNRLLEDFASYLAEGREKEKTDIKANPEASQGELDQVDQHWKAKEVEMRRIWDIAADADGKQRQDPPDWAVDNITFGVMQDPVMTNTGQSYERSSILEHLRRSQTDPLTREPLKIEDLRPNIGLRAACAEFLDNNGWAVDW